MKYLLVRYLPILFCLLIQDQIFPFEEDNSQLDKTDFFCRRIIWLGDLNYRINLPYEKTRELISKKQWSKLAESDQVS